MFGFSRLDETEEFEGEYDYPPPEDYAPSTTPLDSTGEPFSLYPFYILLSLYILALCYDALFESVSYPPVYPKQSHRTFHIS
jgi:hypothetical protein